MAAPVPNDGDLQLQTEWQLDTVSSPAVVNQLLLQIGLPAPGDNVPSGVYLTFGHAYPPTFRNRAEAEAARAGGGTAIQIHQMARLFTTRERLVSFRDLISGFLEQTEAQWTGVVVTQEDA